MLTFKSFWSNIVFSFFTMHKYAKKALYIKIFHRAIGTSKVYVIAAIDRLLLNELSVALISGHLVSGITPLIKIVFVNWLIILLYGLFDKIFQITSTASMMEYSMTMNHALYNKLSTLDMSYFDNPDDNNKVKQSFKDMSGMLSVCDSCLGLVFAVISFFVSFFIVVKLNWIIAILVVVAIIPSFILKRYINNANYKQEQELNNLNRRIEYFGGQFFNASSAQDIRITNVKKLLFEKHKKYTDERNDEKLRLIKKISIIEIMYTIGIGLLNVGINIYILYVILLKRLLIGDFQYYTTITAKLKQSVESVIALSNEILIASIRVENYRNFMNIQNSVKDLRKTPCDQDTFEIEFRHVSFMYPNTKNYVLRDVSFSFSSKQKIAVAGINGAGKTTIVKLLLRFYDPNEGEILLNGINIKDFDIQSYRQKFAVMFQSYVNYNFSIRENITLSNKKISDNSIVNVLKRVNLEHINLNYEYSKSFDPDGVVLSSGQAQSLNFARMLCQDCKIRILDEPSASLDAKAEQRIFDEIFAIEQNKGVILISHRLSNLQSVDKIIFLENGTVAEMGSHKELMKKDGPYKEIYNIQAKKYY